MEVAPLRQSMPAKLMGDDKRSISGTLTLTPTELQWRAATELEPELSLALSSMGRVTFEREQITPFCCHCCHVTVYEIVSLCLRKHAISRSE